MTRDCCPRGMLRPAMRVLTAGTDPLRKLLGVLGVWQCYPCDEGLLATWHALVKGLAASEDLQEHHPEAVYVTPPRQHAHGGVPASRTAEQADTKSNTDAYMHQLSSSVLAVCLLFKLVLFSVPRLATN